MYLCNVSGLEIQAPRQPNERSFHFLTGYAYTTQCSTAVLEYWSLLGNWKQLK